MYEDSRWERRPHGAFIVDGQEVASTMQCCHCGAHFVSIRGSGVRRGFCMKCMQVTCGKPECDPCKPLQKWLEEQEKKGKDLEIYMSESVGLVERRG